MFLKIIYVTFFSCFISNIFSLSFLPLSTSELTFNLWFFVSFQFSSTSHYLFVALLFIYWNSLVDTNVSLRPYHFFLLYLLSSCLGFPLFYLCCFLHVFFFFLFFFFKGKPNIILKPTVKTTFLIYRFYIFHSVPG